MQRIESTVRMVNNSINGTHFPEISTDNATARTLYEEYEEAKMYLDFEKSIRIYVPIVFGLITAIGLVGNALTVAVVLLNKPMQNVTNILIMSLAVADLLFIVFCVPFTAVHLLMSVWPFGDVWCRIVQYLIPVCAFASMYILVLISFDRYLALVHPIRAMSMRTKRNCYIALIVIWSIILLGNVPLILENAELYYKLLGEERAACTMQNLSFVRVFNICFFLFGYMLPLTLICVLYAHVLKVFLTIHILGENNHTGHVRLQSRKRVTKMVIIVVMVFAICWLPIHIIFLFFAFTNHPGNVLIFSLQNAARCMAYINSCINPILYTFYSKTFRKGFRDIVFCKKRNHPENDTAITRQ